MKDLAFISNESPLGTHIALGFDSKALKSLNAIRQDESATSQKLEKDVLDIAGDWEIRNPDSRTSLKMVQRLASTQAIVDARDYETYVVEYAVEWEIVVLDQAETELARVHKLKLNRKHYEQKVEGLEKQIANIQSKGKDPKADLLEKLERNRSKCNDAIRTHDWESGRLYSLLHTVLYDGWQDLYRLAISFMRWESDRVAGEHDIYSPLGRIMDTVHDTYDNKESIKWQKRRSKSAKKKGPPKRTSTSSKASLASSKSSRKKAPPKRASTSSKASTASSKSSRRSISSEEDGISVEEILESDEELELSHSQYGEYDLDEDDYVPDDDSDHGKGHLDP